MKMIPFQLVNVYGNRRAVRKVTWASSQNMVVVRLHATRTNPNVLVEHQVLSEAEQNSGKQSVAPVARSLNGQAKNDVRRLSEIYNDVINDMMYYYYDDDKQDMMINN